MEKKEAIYLVLRYVFLAVLGVFNLELFYYVFSPLTVYPVYWILSLIYENTTLLQGNLLFFSGVYAQIIPACIAGAAYYLLVILNFAMPLKISQRIKSLVFLAAVFLALNILRIVVFGSLLVSGSQYFDVAHEVVWYFGSTVMVVIIWFVNVWAFKIKEIPVYTDFRNILKDVSN